MRPFLVAAMLATLAACGGTGSSTTATRAAAKTIHVRLTGQTHHPRVGEKWHYEVRVTDGAGRAIPADIHLQFLFNGIPVGQVGRHHVVDGVWSETFGTPGNPAFPARARGQPLVLQAIAKARGQTAAATYPIRVR